MAFETDKNALSDHLKALDHQVDIGKGKPFPNSHFLYIIVGGVGSGKTTLGLSLLKIKAEDGGFRKKYNQIYVVSPTAKYDPKWEKLIEEVDADGNYYTECTDETIGEIIDKLEMYNEDFAEEQKEKRMYEQMRRAEEQKEKSRREEQKKKKKSRRRMRIA